MINSDDLLESEGRVVTRNYGSSKNIMRYYSSN